MIVQGALAGTPAVHAAGLLRDELARQGVEGDVHGGYGLALVSVRGDLVIWTDGMVYRWWTGRMSPKTGRRLYAVYGVDNPATVARGVMLRHAELRGERRHSVAPPPDRTVPPPGRAVRPAVRATGVPARAGEDHPWGAPVR
ncbi:hypothetical protein [Streptosporangium carneum]|uniref:hypothetical protein n=1 Tax=Streptosporangium carneum TaxID=47481 RepID=UPI0022F2D1A0|nr:hypothetical protein [Streptosporangium carneum]